MFHSNPKLTPLLMFVLFQSVAAGQGKFDDSEGAVSRGEELILEVARNRQLLPERWASHIHFSVDATPESELYVSIRGESYIWSDSKAVVTVRRRIETEEQAVGSIESDFFEWEGKNHLLLMFNDGKWELAKKGQDRPHIDPFTLCFANSSILHRGIHPDYVEMAFLGMRSCFGLKGSKRRGIMNDGIRQGSPTITS